MKIYISLYWYGSDKVTRTNIIIILEINVLYINKFTRWHGCFSKYFFLIQQPSRSIKKIWRIEIVKTEIFRFY